MPRRYKRSETDFLKLKKHDNVETNTEKFDIENYLNGNWDKINENAKKVNTDISNINSKNKEQDTNIEQLQENTETSSNKIAKLEKELKEAQEDFYQNSVRGQASGEYIHVEDSSNCRARIGISGNSEQETRSGKNYLNTLAKYKSGEKVTVDGITYTFNEDGSITCNGTATEDSLLTFSSNLQTINGSSKKIVGMITGTQVPKKLSILAYTRDWSKNTAILFSSVNKNITINMQENVDYTIFRIITYKGTTLNNQTIYYQILDTSVNDLTYEQYGVMPSPDYLSNITVVGSNVNLFDKNKFNNFTKNLQYIELTLKPNTEYTMRSNITRDKDGCNLFAYKTGEAASSGSNFVVDGTDRIVTTGDDGIIIIAYRNYNASLSDDPQNDYKYKLVEGTEVGEYSKYGQGCVKVTKCNKNLAIKNIKGYFSISDFKIKIDNNSESFLFYAEKGKEYTRSCKVNLDRNRIGKIDTLDVTQGMTVLNGQEINSKKFICDDSGIYIWFVNSTLNDSIKESFQIEEGSTESSFEQHEEQSYIMPTQKEMLQGDYFDFDNEEEVHVWNKKVLDGTENWAYEKLTSADGEKNNFYLKIDDAMSNGKVYSNAFIQRTFLADNYSMFMSAGKNLNLRYQEKSSSTEFKAYLKSQYDAGTPVVVYYQLETPIRLKFTDEQKAVAKELNNARTYKNVTNITTDSKAILSLDYAKDLETQNQKIQNEIDEIKQLLSTTQTSALLLDNMQTDIESEVE